MRKTAVFLLIAFLALGGIVCGCQSAAGHIPASSETAAASVSTDIMPDAPYAEDTGALMKMYSLCCSAENPTMLKREFLALVYAISKEDSGYMLTIDKIEETAHEDPKEAFYTNAEVKKEKYAVDFNDAEDMVILTDPHNQYHALTFDGLRQYIDDCEGAVPLYFYSSGDEIVMLCEIMLP